MPTPRSLTRIVVMAAMLCGVARAADPAGLWIDVPFVAQTTDGCGAASIAMVMQYWQQHLDKPATDAADYARIEHALYAPQARGIYASAIERYFAQNGYRVFAFTGDAAVLQEHLAKGRPLIAALKPGAGATLHYVVVVGIDPARQTVLVNDPAQRKLLTEDAARFEREWAATGHWTLLAVPLAASEVTAR